MPVDTAQGESAGKITEVFVGYARVSTKGQAEDGVSLPDQEQALGRWCELRGSLLKCVISDPAESAENLKRPGLTEALSLLDSGAVDGLVVAKVDRLTRDVGDWATLLRRFFGPRAKTPKRLVSIHDNLDLKTAAGRFAALLWVGLAQLERETTVERTQGAMNFKRSEGQRLGTVPYGWDSDPDGKRNKEGKLIDLKRNEAEQAIIAVMENCRAAGETDHQIAKRWNDSGIATKKQKGPWRASTVAAILGRKGETT